MSDSSSVASRLTHPMALWYRNMGGTAVSMNASLNSPSGSWIHCAAGTEVSKPFDAAYMRSLLMDDQVSPNAQSDANCENVSIIFHP